ncbi:MAG: hypothetical protein ACRCYC_11455 [Paraclostridium sp.]|uniref:hypothetical protein n=1 Tax=Paraclostridium sp. TaxID=2023273 RepID=UPI003F3D009C
MRIASKKSNKTKSRKRVNKTKNQIKEVPVEEVVLNDIMDKEDREAEIVLNDLVPEKDKEQYGMKINSNNKSNKGGIKLKLNLFPKNKKSTKKNKNSKASRNEIIKEIKEDEIVENTNNSEE